MRKAERARTSRISGSTCPFLTSFDWDFTLFNISMIVAKIILIL